jgi:hypothetical protein
MVTEGNDGSYCSICGRIPPDKITTKRITIDGRETGIDQLDWIISEVQKLGLNDESAIAEELLRRTAALNYVPSKKREVYGVALLAAYRESGGRKEAGRS